METKIKIILLMFVLFLTGCSDCQNGTWKTTGFIPQYVSIGGTSYMQMTPIISCVKDENGQK